MTIEAEKSQLLKQGSGLIHRLQMLLQEVTLFEVTLERAFMREELQQLDEKFRDLYIGQYAQHENDASVLLTYMATARRVEQADGSKAAPNLDTLSMFNVYSRQVSTQLETLRSLVLCISARLNDCRAFSNTMVAISISVASIMVAVTAILISLIF